MFAFRCLLASLALAVGTANEGSQASIGESNVDGFKELRVGQEFLVSTSFKSRSLCLQRTDFQILDTPWSLRWADCDIDEETQKWSTKDGVLSGVGALSRKSHVAVDPPVGLEYLEYVSRSLFGIYLHSPQTNTQGYGSPNRGLTSLDFWYDSTSKMRKDRSPVHFTLVDQVLRTAPAHMQAEEYCLAMPSPVFETAVFTGFDNFNSVPAVLSKNDISTDGCSTIYLVQIHDERQESTLKGERLYNFAEESPTATATWKATKEEDNLVQAAISVLYEGSTKIASM